MRILFTLVLFLISSFCFAQQKAKDLSGIAQQMSFTVSDLLSHSDSALIEKILTNSVQNYPLQGVVLFSKALNQYHAAWPDKGSIHFQTSDSLPDIPESESLEMLKKPIFHEGKKLGELILFLRPFESAIPLNEKERAYLKSHPIIKVSNELDFPPYDFAIEGKPQGYNIDLIELIAEKVGFGIQFVNGYTWQELIDRLKTGDLDLIHAAKVTPERQTYALFSNPYRRLKTYFVTLTNHPEITDIQQLYGKTFAVGKGWFQEEYMQTHYPQINLLQVSNTLEMLEAVSSGKAEATAGSGDVLQYIIKKQGMRDLKIGNWFKEIDQGQVYTHHFMVQQTAPALISILNKTLAILSIGELDALEQKWFGKLTEPISTTELTNQEIEFLKRHSQLTIFHHPQLPPYSFFEEGEAKGYWIDLLELMFQDLDVELVHRARDGESRNYPEVLNRGDADVMTSLLITSQRQETMLFSDPVITVGYPAIIVRKETEALSNLKALQGKRIALVQNHPFERGLQESGITYHLVPAKSLSETLEAVSYGLADVTLHDNSMAEYWTRKQNITNLTPTGQAKLPGMNNLKSAFAVAKDQPLLQGLLNRLLSQIDPINIDAIQKKWLFSSAFVSINSEIREHLALSSLEHQFLNEMEPLTFCVDPNWMPFERINNQGQHEGLTHDLISEVASRLGLTMQLIPTETWNQSLEYIQQGRCLLLAAAAETESRREYLEFTQPHSVSSLVVAVRNEELFIENLSSIRNRTLGVVTHYAHKEIIQEKYPDLKLLEVKDVSEGLAMVRDKKIFGFVDTVPTINYQMRREGIVDLKIGGTLDLSLALSLAVRKGEPPELLSLLNKTLNSFSQEEKRLLADKWFSIRIEKVFDYTRLWQILGGVAILLILILYWNRKLAEKARLHKELSLSNMRLDLALASSDLGWWDWDAPTHSQPPPIPIGE